MRTLEKEQYNVLWIQFLSVVRQLRKQLNIKRKINMISKS